MWIAVGSSGIFLFGLDTFILVNYGRLRSSRSLIKYGINVREFNARASNICFLSSLCAVYLCKVKVCVRARVFACVCLCVVAKAPCVSARRLLPAAAPPSISGSASCLGFTPCGKRSVSLGLPLCYTYTHANTHTQSVQQTHSHTCLDAERTQM